MKQFADLARGSSREQVREVFSFEVQEEALYRYTPQAGGEIVKFVKIAGTSSKREQRKTFGELIGRKAIEFLAAHVPHWLPRITRSRGQTTERLFWQSGGGYDRNVITQKTLLKMIDDIHANPVCRGLVERPRD